MSNDKQSGLFIWGGASGVAGTLCYIAAVALPLNVTGSFILVIAWPILSIIFLYSLFSFINEHKRRAANTLAFIFACLAFTLLAAMVSAQLAVNAGTEEFISKSPASEQERKMIQQSIRLVDNGIDVAWDMFIGAALIFLAFALKNHPAFGVWWAVPCGVLALLLIVFNASTFPWPPNTKNLFDVGPAIGLYIIFLAARLLVLGIKMKHT